MSPRNLALILAAALAAGILVWIAVRKEEAAPAPAVRAPALPAPERPAHEPPSSSRSAVATAATEPAAALPRALEVRGRIVDPAGAPIAGLRVGASSEDVEGGPSAISEPGGAFALRAVDLPSRIAVVEAGWTTLNPADLDVDATGEDLVLVAVRPSSLSGQVVDGSRRPLSGARLELRVDAALLDAIPGARSGPGLATWTSASGSGGAFAFDGPPGAPRMRLATSLSGWRTDERTLDLTNPLEITIALERDELAGPEIEGSVVHADGTPAAGALVAFGSARTSTDVNGAFRLACLWFGPVTPLAAAARGLEPAVIEDYGARIDRRARSLPPERLVLPGPALSISGRVLSARGEPLKGWRVAIEDPTRLDPDGLARDSAESHAAKRVEGRTDGQGAFRIDGLRARTYSILAWGRERDARVELAVGARGVQAGARDLVLQAPEASARATVRGRVRTLAGAPVAGARAGIATPLPAGAPGALVPPGRLAATTRDDGTFEIPDAPPGLLAVVVSGDRILPARVEVEGTGEVEVRVRQRRDLRVDAARAVPRPDAVCAVDEHGAPTPVFGGAALARLVDGASGVLAVGDDARELVLYRGCAELGRIAIPADPAGTVLSWP